MSGDKGTGVPQLIGSHSREWLQIVAALAVCAPAPVLRTLMIADAAHPELPPLAESAIFGVSILAAATMLVWATEVAEQLVSAMLALAVLAIVAILPEYAVDLYFAWTAPDDPENAHFALANMTGANRLLVGFAWPLVFFIFWWRGRRRDGVLRVGEQNSIGLVFLGVATIYNFTLPLRRHLHVVDGGVLIALFLVYLFLSSRSPPREEQPLVGPAQAIAALPIRLRWTAVIGIFAMAAGTVFSAAEPFAEGLVDTGKDFGIDEFILVQWVAPLASEAPEFILAALLAFRGRAQAGLTLLISAEVNQWTLLVGSLPAAYAVSGMTIDPLPMEGRQAAEVFLTGGQALFALAILMSLSINVREAALLFGLFVAQLAVPLTEVRLAFGALYALLGLFWFATERRELPRLLGTARVELAAHASAGNPGHRAGEGPSP
jgi:cation:H+ antiporter